MTHLLRHIITLLVLFYSLISKADFNLSIGHTAYATDPISEMQSNHYTEFNFHFNDFGKTGSWFYNTEILSLFSLDESKQYYISLPNLFIGYEIPNIFSDYNFSFVLGRQKRTNILSENEVLESDTLTHPEPWSFMDEVWHLGLWQGRINWDYLLYKPQGLTGSFFTLENGLWSMTLFVSGLFLPDHEPVIDISPRGEIYSKNRWFNPLQSDFIIFNRRIEAYYWLEKPFLKNVILNESIAFRFRFGDTNKQWFNTSFAYKPINQTYFKTDGGFSINDDSINHFIYYQPFKHYLLSIDFGMKTKWIDVILSATQEKPNRPKVPETWIVPILPAALLASIHIKLKLKEYISLIDYVELNGLYSYFSNPETEKTDPNSTLEFNLAATRFKLHSGFSLSAYTPAFQWKNQTFQLGINYWHSLPEEGQWLNASFKWKIHNRLSLELYMDILGSLLDSQETFFNIYRHNDRFITRLVYTIR